MRTSHRQIRKRILDAKSKITDEEFFSSRAYCGYLTDLAEAATKCICDGVVSVMIWISYEHSNGEKRKSILISLKAEAGIPPRNTAAFLPILRL